MCDFDDYDFEDDYAEDAFMDECDDLDMESDLPDDMAIPDPEASEPSFDLGEALILSGMIFGQAYEEAVTEKEQRKKKKAD